MLCEGLERGTLDGGMMQLVQLDFLGNRLDFFAQTFWNPAKSNFERIDDDGAQRLQATLRKTFLATFLAAFLATLVFEFFGD